MTYISLCIPRIEYEFDVKYVKTSMDKLELGAIEKIDLVVIHKHREEPYKRAFIHYRNWNPEAANIYDILQEPNQCIKLIHKLPDYWKIYKSRSGSIKNPSK